VRAIFSNLKVIISPHIPEETKHEREFASQRRRRGEKIRVAILLGAGKLNGISGCGKYKKRNSKL